VIRAGTIPFCAKTPTPPNPSAPPNRARLLATGRVASTAVNVVTSAQVVVGANLQVSLLAAETVRVRVSALVNSRHLPECLAPVPAVVEGITLNILALTRHMRVRPVAA